MTRSSLPLGLLLTWAAAASAQTPIAPGITYFAANGYHVVVVDVGSGHAEVRVGRPHSTPQGDMIDVAAHAAAEGATVAINANYFGGSTNNPCGAARGFGQQFYQAYPEPVNCETTLGWSNSSLTGAVFDTAGHTADPAFMSQLSEETTGGGYLLQNGQRHDWNHNKLEEGRDCTAIGISADRKKLILVATDTTACTGAGLQSVLLQYGAADAIHLDGGGSTKMWIQGMGYVNDEPQDRLPSVAVIARPPSHCPADCGAARCVQLLPPFEAQCVGQACRGGLAALWNCDTGHLRRARCDPSGKVTYEYCAMGCSPQPPGQNDLCVGGAIPEPDAGVDAGSLDAGRPPDDAGHPLPDAGAPLVDAGAPSADAGAELPPPPSAPPAATDRARGGCTSATGALPLALAALALAALRRRRGHLGSSAAGPPAD